MDSIDISAIIIDDDLDAINLLEMFLRQFPNIKIVGKSTDPNIGLSLVIKKFPDLVFLDIDMPDMTGLQVADAIRIRNFHSEIVFTTAYQDYAYKTLPIEPLDFLTKPFSSDDLQKVIKKYMAKAEKKKLEQKMDKFIQSQTNPPKISLPIFHSFLIIDINDIVYIKANENKTIVYLHDGTVETVIKNLSSLIQMLNSTLFFQIHRSTYVNLNYIQRIDKKKAACIIRFNNTLREETITRNNIINFEKLDIFPGT
jgi:DNA-binding LytR/AlgR family response regulator